ncbi:Aspartyl aminopeptidase [Neolecta irregularis DAH-3]|uniref:aspartyl aminopeptidase n=1 Tax=Neolecta irregularis (strain DAH-3) TaxID=1198029 RepID=A0A1U7LQE7_NEOID|nr:Aspartyl aminopeptidase [Neolecta irregularis DAH-3]|eukprot:OLL24848.1 Aspartyl aminopeptidase [Neolecta irregularis DAH-3]
MSCTFLSESARSYATDFLAYVNASPTPYHAVANAKAMLKGYTGLKERDAWAGKIETGGKYYVKRNGSSLIAFTVGMYPPGNAMSIVGAHTDSPALRLKPVSKKISENYLQVGVETYGGGIWHSWFDRDLSIAGRVMVQSGDTFKHELIKIDKPLLRIPTIAIHLDRDVNAKFEFNTETHLTPILGLVQETLNGKPKEETADKLEQLSTCLSDRHDSDFIKLLASNLGVKAHDIHDFELLLYDTQPACLGGLYDEFVFAARQDNLVLYTLDYSHIKVSSFCATRGLVESDDSPNDETIRLACLFDDEEIGSTTAQGANSDFLPSIIRRLSTIKLGQDQPSSTAFEETLRKSFLISADQAHAVHPNYASKHESSHKPQLNKGPVIKINANARYATNAPGIVLVQQVCKKVQVPLQLFVAKNDSPSGSTIGPMLSAKMGMRTLDIGNPQLSMHSIRETGGSRDIELAVKLFKGFFENFGILETQITVD